jgi:hypothetical protein
VNQKNEDEIKAKSLCHQKNFSAAQKAVAKHHEKKEQSAKKAETMQTDG